MPFSDEYKKRSPEETKTRTGANYVKFSPDYKIVLRILDTHAKSVWKHWIGEANGGKGMMAVCPNVTSQTNACPICESLRGLPKDNAKVQERRAKRRFITNVLDRTPVTICQTCSAETVGKKCQSCGADLRKHEFVPLNRIKILEGGPRLFNQTLNPLEKLQAEEFENATITDYDISFSSVGELRDRQIAALPQPPSELPEDALKDPETGERQTLFDLDLLAEPDSVERINLMLKGATLEEINAV